MGRLKIRRIPDNPDTVGQMAAPGRRYWRLVSYNYRHRHLFP